MTIELVTAGLSPALDGERDARGDGPPRFREKRCRVGSERAKWGIRKAGPHLTGFLGMGKLVRNFGSNCPTGVMRNCGAVELVRLPK
jgi:hypothetical protein